MFYSQSIEHIRLIILSLDGGLLDLNRLRYNYFNHTCKTYGHTISREQFSPYLGNMNTMYQCSPIQDIISNQDLNKLIEKDLFEYAKLKQNIKKEGVDELLQFCRQKQIKIAVVSTHKSKRAIQYLQLTGIYKYIDFVIGGDSQLKPLPSQDILATICHQMKIQPKNTLVVANYESLVLSANKLLMNIIYMPDLVKPTPQIEASVYRIARNNLEVINIFLFSKYDSVEIFSPVLGMSRQMNYQVLTKTYHQLLEKYQNDSQLINLVNRTYEHFLILLEEDNEKTKALQKRMNQNIDKTQLDNHQVEQTKKDQEITATNHQEVPQNIGNQLKNKNNHEENQKEEQAINSFSTTSAITLEASRINELMDIINGNAAQEIEEEINETSTDDVDEKKENHFLNKIIDFIYTILLSTIVVLAVMIANVALSDYLNRDSIIAHMINAIVTFYFFIVENISRFIFDFLHNLIYIIPQYDNLLAGNRILSPLAMRAVVFIIFNTAVIYLCRLVYYLIRRLSKKEDHKNV